MTPEMIEMACGICNGSGVVGPDGDMVTEQPCGQCDGSGIVYVVAPVNNDYETAMRIWKQFDDAETPVYDVDFVEWCKKQTTTQATSHDT